MSEYVLVCSCHNMEKRAREAFSLLFPDREESFPQVVKGRDRIYKLAQSLGNEHIKALSKLSGKYAYYVQLENDKIVKEYDLLRGRRLS